MLEELDDLLKIIEKSGVKMDEYPYSWDRQDDCRGGSGVDGPTMYKGVPYHPLSFTYLADQLNQATEIIEKFKL